MIMAHSVQQYLASVEFTGSQQSPLSDFLKNEQKQALKSLLASRLFQPVNDSAAPYHLQLSIEENRLILRMKNVHEQDLNIFVLSLKPYRRIIQDYFLMLDSYEQAKYLASREKLEAIDMGRRGVHNEGADLLQNRLKDKITMDHETARTLFTLICILHKTQMNLVT